MAEEAVWDDGDMPLEGDPVQVEPETACETRTCLGCGQNYSIAEGEPTGDEICLICVAKRSKQNIRTRG